MSTIININLHKAKTENSIWLYLQNGLGLLWILVSRSIYYLRARWYTFASPTPYSYPEWSNKCYSVVCANVQPEEEIKHWPIKCPHSISTSTDNSLKMSMKKKDEKKLCSRANMEEKNHISYLKRTFYSEFITRSCVNSGSVSVRWTQQQVLIFFLYILFCINSMNILFTKHSLCFSHSSAYGRKNSFARMRFFNVLSIEFEYWIDLLGLSEKFAVVCGSIRER